jgi:PAS domain S-box-containing protein
VAKAINEEIEYAQEYRLVSPRGDGELRWVRAMARKINVGAEWRFDGIVFEISQQKREQERLQALITATSQVIYFTDASGQSVGDNASWRRFTGQTQEEIRNGHWPEAIHPDDRAGVVEAVTRALKEHRPYVVENRLRRRDGQWRHMKVHGIPLLDAIGNVREWVGACQDITDQKLLESELRATVASRDEFLAIASHEIKNPLSALTLSLQVVRQRLEKVARPGDGVFRLIEVSLSTARRISTLLDELLDLPRIRSGKLLLSKQRVDLSQLVTEAVSQMSEQLKKSGSTVHIFAPGKVLGEWDSSRIGQVVTNLLSNAIKYGEGKSIEINISIVPSGRIRLEVKDRGIGIPPGKHSLIFRRFERVATGREIAGLGLGLYIVKQIVDAHGGSIWVESDVGRGSTFVVELPLKVDQPLNARSAA